MIQKGGGQRLSIFMAEMRGSFRASQIIARYLPFHRLRAFNKTLCVVEVGSGSLT